ncbi:MAG: PepSY domain-containing protein [Hominisplanchenecus sp.]|nr:PepSY domain-containing protein [Hominisplanchenecus sp.]
MKIIIKMILVIGILGLLITGCQKQSGQAETYSEADAVAAALAHAQVSESDVTAYCVKRGIEDGVEIYDVEFYVGSQEYDYEIRISDGSILEADYEIENDFRITEKGKEGEITPKEAEKIALDKVPGAGMIHMERKVDDGRVVYEGDIYHEHREYEFKIDASTGEMIEWKQD